MRTNKMIAVASVAALSLSLAACGDDSSSGGTVEGDALSGAQITVGSKDFDEQLILGNISKLVLEAAGADVTDQINLGGTDAARAALTAGEINTYWEYNGTAWISFFKETTPIPDRIEQYEAVRDRDKEENNLVWLQPAVFNNTYGIAFPTEAADELGNPETISDLGELVSSNPEAATLCIESEFAVRDDGLPGLEKAYGFDIPKSNETVLDTALVYTAADKQDPCNFGEVFTSDGRIAGLELTVLEDDKGFFPLYNPSPVFTADVYEQYGEELDAIFDPISEALDQDAINGMNAEVSVNAGRPEQVAEDWLTENGFL